ncbi:MAG TPA: hypothetical protein DIS66_01220 [Candidatus Omnitrophica bacterium]|nr:hypothetical protein [Candidatus Omnitrophota bacterium]
MKTDFINGSIEEGANILLHTLGNLAEGEKLCIVSDTTTRATAEIVAQQASAEGFQVDHQVIAPLQVHGQEPPEETRRSMLSADLVMGMTHRSMAHSKTRGELCRGKGRYLSLPEYSVEMLKHPSLRADYKKSAAKAKLLADKFTEASSIEIKTPAGTNIRLSAKGRLGNFCPGYVTREYKLGSPPDIESNVSPVEDSAEGVVVVDGSVPMSGMGQLRSPIKLTVRGGMITSIEAEKQYKDILEPLFEKFGPKSRVLAECGVGFNEKAKLCGNMLIDEGCLGTFHFGFGSNSTVGGKNEVSFHLDFIYYAKEMLIDGVPYSIS